jgi:hypothetical protein
MVRVINRLVSSGAGRVEFGFWSSGLIAEVSSMTAPTDASIGPTTSEADFMAGVEAYIPNLNARLDDLVREQQLHPGEDVARSLDGRIDYAYAPSIEELTRKLNELGIDPQRVVFDRVPSPDCEVL